jgi:cholest-4-en-3-one 26-monooxygenase
MAELTELDTKLLDPTWYHDDSYLDSFRRLRDEDPVHWTEDARYGKNYWAITRFEDCQDLLLANDEFSNRWDTHVPLSPARITPEERFKQGFDVGLAFTDNPVHDLYRRPMNRHFSVPAIAKLTDMATESIDGILRDAAGAGTQEAVNGIAIDIPTQVVLRWFGIPADEWEDVQKGVRGSGRGFTPVSSSSMDGGAENREADHNPILDYSERLAADRLAEPRDDFLSTVAHLRIDGAPVTLHEATANTFHLLEGALGNSRNAIAMGTWLLLEHPEQTALVEKDPSLLPDAVDEMLRYATNSPTRLRIANKDTEFRGREINAGDWLVAFLKSANFDERAFPEPERFDVTRRPKHLSFGAGIHNCLGRHLARLEMTILFRRLTQDYRVEFDGEPEWGTNAPGSNMLSRLPIRISHR